MAAQAKTKAQARVIYLYGISRKNPAGGVRSEGVDGASPVEPVECSGLVCWVSRVDGTEFGEQLATKMEDLEWLATAGVRHQHAVGEIAKTVDILPARFGTVFVKDKNLEDHVRERKRDLEAGLKKIAGSEEWGVKVFAEKRQRPSVQAGIASGADYLKRKAAQLHTQERRTVAPEVRELQSALERLASDTAAVGKVSGAQPNLEWQSSYLLPRAKRGEFEKILQRFAAKMKGMHRIECTGPWPPYSFVPEGSHGR